MSASDVILSRFLALHPKLIDLSLGRIERLLETLGRPQDRLPPVIHVAGTNGKGSTIAFMRAILEASGLSAHVYTSPHLVRFHERIRLGRRDRDGRAAPGRFVEEEALVDAFRACEGANDGQPITVFEITTAAALLLFSRHPADALLLEVGLGGRFDATNVVPSPRVSVITPVSMDHAEFLGDTVAKIAGEKAGILRRGVRGVVAPQGEDALAAIERHAERVGAPLLVGNQDFLAREENGRLVYEDADGLLDLPPPRLPGRHQVLNAGTAIAALRASGLLPRGLAPSAWEAGVTRADWPARLQRLTKGGLLDRLPDGSELWLDGGHNADGGRVLAEALADMEEQRPRPLVLVVGMLAAKDASAFLKPFVGLAQDLIAVPVPNQVAARPAAEVEAAARACGLRATSAAGLDAALAAVSARVWGVKPRVLVTGSLYLAGAVLAANGTPPV